MLPREGQGSSNSAKESLSTNATRESKWTQERKREDSGYNINKTIVSDRSTADPARTGTSHPNWSLNKIDEPEAKLLKTPHASGFKFSLGFLLQPWYIILLMLKVVLVLEHRVYVPRNMVEETV